MNQTGKRHEIKYSINNVDYITLKHRLDCILKRDNNCPQDGYTVSSLYFDNIYDTAYCQKIDGDAIRHKYRIRFYNDNSHKLKLEKKSKIHQMTHKESDQLTNDELGLILNGDYDFLKEKNKILFKEFYNKLSMELYKPKSWVRYNRIAYEHPIGNVRITLDNKINASYEINQLPHSAMTWYPVSDVGDAILEIKFNGVIPDFIRHLIQPSNGFATSASKYILSRKYN